MMYALAGLSARERNRLKRLAKQNQKRGGLADALPAAKRAKADANGSSTVLRHRSLSLTRNLCFEAFASWLVTCIAVWCVHQHEQSTKG